MVKRQNFVLRGVLIALGSWALFAALGIYVARNGEPAALAALAKELLETEATGNRARAEAWFTKYGTMPAALKTALAATSEIPVDIEPVSAFPDDAK